MLPFKKYEGLGNDFIIPATIHLPSDNRMDPLRSLNDADRMQWAKLCDRRLSIGADGVLLHYETTDQRHFMTIINQDGSLAEMCGNGLRCMAVHLFDKYQQRIDSFEIETLAGMMRAQVHKNGVCCHIGPATLEGQRCVEIAGIQFGGYFVNTGNPHFVIFDDLETEIQQRHAQALSQHASFAHGANISFASVLDDGIKLSVYERGCGWTQACGTAAIATTAAYWSKNSCESRAVSVHLPGGTLNVSGKFQDMIMDGPASLTFSGQIHSAITSVK
jgi:diaminopimelate epimerase